MRAAVLMAIQDYRSRLATENPFPSPSQENNMAASALVRACVTCLVSFEEDELFDDAVSLASHFTLASLNTKFFCYR
jgi:hypothetical protein